MLYGAEYWTVSRTDEKPLDVFERKHYEEYMAIVRTEFRECAGSTANTAAYLKNPYL